MTTRPTGLPTPTTDPKQVREMLRTVKEMLEVAQRQRGDPMSSFVRLEELTALGLADTTGRLLPHNAAALYKRIRAHVLFRSA